MAVSGSLNKVADALMFNPGGPPSPSRRTAAIRAVKQIDALTQTQKIQIVQLITADTNIADSFLALDGPDDEDLRIAYLLAEINTPRA
jgi:hypothetical protein